MIRLSRLCLRLVFAVLVIAWIVGSLPVIHPRPALAKQGNVVETEGGLVRGIQSGDTYAFLGIPFAAPPLSDLRWQPPVDPQPWAGELDAVALGPACPQWDDDAGVVVGAEACLTLNVWTPITATPGSDFPVMVFIHGGGNVQGSAANPLYDSQVLAARGDVVVVTVQYRLGALGFLVHPGLAAESGYGGSGNYGLMDQIKALEWVQTNIRNFGGDPAQVLLFGESGGAEDTCMLLASPLADGLFSRALMQSGGCLAKPAAERSTEGVAFTEAAGCGSDPDPVLCLRSQTTTTLVTAIDTTPITRGLVTQAFGPNVDGYVLLQSPYNALALGDHNPVPFVVGSNADEMLPLAPVMSETAYNLLVQAMLDAIRPGAGAEALALYPVGAGPGEYPAARQAYGALVSDGQFTCPTRRIARLAAASQDEPVYRYFFTRVLDSPLYASWGSFHGLELSYVFQHVADLQYYSPKAEDIALEATMLGYWTRFAAAGDPNGGGAAAWPLYATATDPYLELGAEIVDGTDVRPEKCDFWDSLAAPSFALRMTTSAAAVQAGDRLTYTLTLVNGGGNASGVVISNTLDSAVSLLWASDDGLDNNGVLTWDVGAFSATQRITRSLVVTVGDVPGGALLVNRVWIASSEAITATETVMTPVKTLDRRVYLPLVIKATRSPAPIRGTGFPHLHIQMLTNDHP